MSRVSGPVESGGGAFSEHGPQLGSGRIIVSTDCLSSKAKCCDFNFLTPFFGFLLRLRQVAHDAMEGLNLLMGQARALKHAADVAHHARPFLLVAQEAA